MGGYGDGLWAWTVRGRAVNWSEILPEEGVLN